MKFFPIAKINLGLNVVERRQDGYHNLETVFYPVPISDELEVTEQKTADKEHDCELTLEGIAIEGDVQSNLVVKAYRLLKEDFPEMPRVSARLKKVFPRNPAWVAGQATVPIC